MDQMKEALTRRRGKGMDLQILLNGEPVLDGTAEINPDQSDLAPTPDDKGGPMASPDDEAPEMMGAPDQADGDQPPMNPLEGMSAPDRQDLAARKPRSLGDRMRQEQMSLQKK